MLCIVIKGPSIEEAHQQILKAHDYADFVELRLDYFTSLDLNAILTLRSHFSIPMIFTLRNQIQGGNYAQSEEMRLADIRKLLTLKPEYFDLENNVPPSFIEEVSSNYPEIKLIYSYHNFEETPPDLDDLYHEMQKTPVFFYKIAVKAQNSLDALRLICWTKNCNDHKLIAISMGQYGQISRILSPLMGCPFTYASLDEDPKSAPGQLSAKTLIEKYHHRFLNPNTAIYGLIGDPVSLSISDITHNHLISFCGLDAVYIKIQVTPSELSDFFQFARQLPIHGLSVTMPLKEHVIPLLDEIDAQALKIGAVNTLIFEKDKILGFNTDGVGALNAIENNCLVRDKHIVIVGAGGAAKAIAYEAHRRGGRVTILNRDDGKAHNIAQNLDCIGMGLDNMAACAEAGYDILINCTPVPLPIKAEYILSNAIVMDIVTKPMQTIFLTMAKEKGCGVIYGYRMFIEQALGQFTLWFNDRLNIQEGREILNKIAEECLIQTET